MLLSEQPTATSEQFRFFADVLAELKVGRCGTVIGATWFHVIDHDDPSRLEGIVQNFNSVFGGAIQVNVEECEGDFANVLTSKQLAVLLEDSDVAEAAHVPFKDFLISVSKPAKYDLGLSSFRSLMLNIAGREAAEGVDADIAPGVTNDVHMRLQEDRRHPSGDSNLHDGAGQVPSGVYGIDEKGELRGPQVVSETRAGQPVKCPASESDLLGEFPGGVGEWHVGSAGHEGRNIPQPSSDRATLQFGVVPASGSQAGELPVHGIKGLSLARVPQPVGGLAVAACEHAAKSTALLAVLNNRVTN